jgi:dienelactone hydrolase
MEMIMAEVVLYHHVHGLTKGVEAFADTLRQAGHTVHVPDLFEGRTFTTLDDGIAHARQVGFGTIQERGIAAAEELDPALVYAGFSLGVMPAQRLAQTRAGARGALLFHACLPVSEFGESWPAGVPVQIHSMDSDPEFVDGGDLDAARSLVDSTDQAELFLYPGEKHLFADSSLPSYDEAAGTLLTGRALDFLEGLPRPTAS